MVVCRASRHLERCQDSLISSLPPLALVTVITFSSPSSIKTSITIQLEQLSPLVLMLLGIRLTVKVE